MQVIYPSDHTRHHPLYNMIAGWKYHHAVVPECVAGLRAVPAAARTEQGVLRGFCGRTSVSLISSATSVNSRHKSSPFLGETAVRYPSVRLYRPSGQTFIRNIHRSRRNRQATENKKMADGAASGARCSGLRCFMFAVKGCFFVKISRLIHLFYISTKENCDTVNARYTVKRKKLVKIPGVVLLR